MHSVPCSADDSINQRRTADGAAAMLFYFTYQAVTSCCIVSQIMICLVSMQINVATSLCAGGETGIFTPMHLLVFYKPEATGKKQ